MKKIKQFIQKETYEKASTAFRMYVSVLVSCFFTWQLKTTHFKMPQL